MNITTETHEGIALISMDDGKMNAITVDSASHLNQAIEEAERNADAIVITGRAGAFCAGFDKAVMIGDDEEAKDKLALSGAKIAQRLFACPKPVVAASTGHAFTIGALWLMSCDTRFGERGEFRYAMTETIMGSTLTDWPMTILESRVPSRLLTPIAVQSLALDPDSAIEAGYLDQVVDAGKSVAEALEAAIKLAQLPAQTYAANKLAVRKGYIARLASALG